MSSPIAREHEFRELRSSGARGYDDLPVNRPDRKRRLGCILAALLILIVVVGGAAAWKFGLLTSKHTVPSLEGLTLTQAAPVLKEDGFTLTVDHEVNSSTVPANTIISQDPAKGTNAKSGLDIVVTDSKGSALVTLPTSLIGETCATATAKLHTLKVTAKCPASSEVASTRTPAGLVAEVVQPRPRPEPNLILRVAGNEPIAGNQQANVQPWQPRPMVPYTPTPSPTPAAVPAEVSHPQPMGNW